MPLAFFTGLEPLPQIALRKGIWVNKTLGVTGDAHPVVTCGALAHGKIQSFIKLLRRDGVLAPHRSRRLAIGELDSHLGLVDVACRTLEREWRGVM